MSAGVCAKRGRGQRGKNAENAVKCQKEVVNVCVYREEVSQVN